MEDRIDERSLDAARSGTSLDVLSNIFRRERHLGHVAVVSPRVTALREALPNDPSNDPSNLADGRHRSRRRSVRDRDDRPRHPTLSVLEDHLAKVAWSRSAGLLDLGNSDIAIVALPTVAWLPGPSDHPKAGRGLLPHPIVWDHPIVLAIRRDRPVVARWTAHAWGTKVSGVVRLRLRLDGSFSRAVNVVSDEWLVARAARADGTSVVSDELLVEPIHPRAAARVIERLHREGGEARWAIHELLAPWLRRSLTAAHRAVSAELRVPRVLDDLSLEDLLSELQLGVGDKAGLIDKVIERLVAGKRPNVDAARYIATTFRRDAELALRRRIDDPRWVGRSLRQFAADHPELRGRELVDRFNESSCLSERVGLDRAMRALAPAVQPLAVSLRPELLAMQPEGGFETGTLPLLRPTAGRRP